MSHLQILSELSRAFLEQVYDLHFLKTKPKNKKKIIQNGV